MATAPRNAGKIVSLPFVDSLMNLVTGLGTAKDKNAYNSYVVNLLTREQLETAFRSDWIARKIITAPAQDATREWRSWQAEKEDITELERVERSLNVPQKVRRALVLARLYGGAALVVGAAGSPESELKPDSVRKDGLKFLHVVSKHDLSTSELETDLMSPYYGEPKMYLRSVPNSAQPQMKIHPSRVIKLVGMELPDERSAHADGWGWGDSVLQIVDDAVKAAGLAQNGIASMINEAKVDVIKIPDLAAKLTTQEYAARLTSRWTYANQIKSFVNALMIDSKEEWERIQVNFTALPDLLKMYLLVASGAADIPATRLLGQSPAGLSATGESDTRNYYDRVRSEQSSDMTPTLARLDELLIRSALGDRPEEIFYEWNPLWQLSENEKADIAVKKAQVFTADVATGLIQPIVLKTARENQLIEDGTYPGFELALEDAPDELPPDSDPEVLEQRAQEQHEMQGRLTEAQVKEKEARAKQLPFGRKAANDWADAWDPKQPRGPDGKWVTLSREEGGPLIQSKELRPAYLYEEQNAPKGTAFAYVDLGKGPGVRFYRYWPKVPRQTKDWDPDQPRDDRGRWTSGLTLSQSDRRAFTGQQRNTRKTLSKLQTGALGERIVGELMKKTGHVNVRPATVDRNNAPVDIAHRDGLVEVKTGQVSNAADSMKWRTTLGEPGPAEKAMLRGMSPEQKLAWNSVKYEAAMARKQQVLREYERKTGRKMTAETYGVILDPDEKIADVYRFQGFKRSVRWRSDYANEAYVGSYRYESK